MTRQPLLPTSFLFLLALLLGGCGLAGTGSAWDPFRTSAERQISVRVDNVTQTDVTVSVTVGAGRTRLGRVNSRSAEIYRIPVSSPQDVFFQIDAVGGVRHTTDAILAGPGDLLELVIQQPLSRSILRR